MNKKRLILALAASLLLSLTACAGGKGTGSYVLGFYNLENLFDTYHDEGKNDYEFLPDGANKWTEARYEKKLHNMATSSGPWRMTTRPIIPCSESAR